MTLINHSVDRFLPEWHFDSTSSSNPLVLHAMKSAVLVLLLCLAAAQAVPQSELPLLSLLALPPSCLCLDSRSRAACWRQELRS